VPHLNLLLFERLLWRLVIFTDGYNSGILKSLADDLVGQVLYIGEALTILCLIFTRDETASHGVATQLIGMMIKSILRELLLCIQKLIGRQNSIRVPIINPGLLPL